MSSDRSGQCALVIGGSLGGLLAAHLLRHSGWDVTVFEGSPEDLTGRGAGINVLPQLIDILRRLGIDFDESMGVKVDTAIFLDHSGATTAQRPMNRNMSSWGRLYRSLRDALPASRYRLRRLRGRLARHRRSAGRRRRHPLDGAVAIPPAGTAALCRLCRLARHAGGGRISAGDSRGNF